MIASSQNSTGLGTLFVTGSETRLNHPGKFSEAAFNFEPPACPVRSGRDPSPLRGTISSPVTKIQNVCRADFPAARGRSSDGFDMLAMVSGLHPNDPLLADHPDLSAGDPKRSCKFPSASHLSLCSLLIH